MFRLKLRNITLRRKLGLIISLINTLIVSIVFILFIASYYYLGLKQIRNDLNIEVDEIITHHLSINGERIVFSNADQGRSIQTDLLTDGASAVIYNSNEEAVGRFGLFEYEDEIFSSEDSQYKKELNDVFSTQEVKYYSKFSLENNDSYEMIIAPIQSEGRLVGVISIAMPVNFYKLLNLSFYIFLVVVPVSILVNFILGKYLAKVAYQPLKELLEKMGVVTIGNIDKKVSVSGHPSDESYQIAENFNKMLDRVNEGIEKQKEFISNASHELKSPLARVITSIDVLNLKLKDNNIKENQEQIKQIKKELVNLSELIDSMLSLSRVKDYQKDEDKINLYNFLTSFCKNYTDIQFNFDISKEMKILFNASVLTVLIRNLVENAEKYASKKEVKFIGKQQGDKLSLVIVNPMDKKTKIDTKKVFDRFYTSSKKSGYGLGLAIVKTIADEYNLTLRVDTSNNEFKITLGGFQIADS